ncbi:HNH endonuclease [Microbacterium phage DizzyRudy]|nr:HNH endonuclease [Microbacterium phage DizzyRudy]
MILLVDDEEVWAEVAGFPDYAVSTHGRVRNVRTHAVLRPRNNSYGYTRVGLRKDGKTHDLYVHHLVAKAFITGYYPGVQIRHANDNSDNSANNLRFRRGVRMGRLRSQPQRARARKVRIIETGEVFLTVENCAKYIGGDVSSIYRVLRGERVSHKGLSFEYYYEEYDGRD